MSKEHANVRKSKMVQANKEVLRDKLKAAEYIRVLDHVSTTIQNEYLTLDTTAIQALKVLTSLQLSLLSKVLPDLKSVEVVNSNENKHETLLQQLDQRKIIDVN